ncbi:MAG: hypothetical protein HQL16_06435 [Candidatus Omnitrophica bacterium]|nr:hypothetical protein [Candidatus Omnitrophota bacterium]
MCSVSFNNLSRFKKFLLASALGLVVLGVILRLYNVRASGFFFYDEGFYLHHNLPVLEFIHSHVLRTLDDKARAAWYYFHSALGSGKSLWFFIMDSRALWGGLYDWGFPKLAACFFGLLTIPLVFLFSRRYYGSSLVAITATALFAVFPGAVFYSRIGLQEAFSTFLVLGGFYLYIFPRAFGWRTFAAGVVLAAAFFSNYRLIMLPLSVLVCEFVASRADGRGISWRKYIWFTVVFAACVVGVGNLCNGANTTVIAMWVFHQGAVAGGEFAWINFLSYPYYMFRLETWFLALAFFASAYFLIQRRWNIAIPLALAFFHMLFFSLPSEKGARYIAVMFPFIAMGVAFTLKTLWDVSDDTKRKVLVAFAIVMVAMMSAKAVQLAQASSDHQKVVSYLHLKDPQIKFMSSQEMVDDLYVFPHDQVKPIPPRFEDFVALYTKGYRYLVLDPQAYVSQVEKHKFTVPLRSYLSFIDANVEPVKIFPHMNEALLERFVFEHSENLGVSVKFLSSEDIQKVASIRVYDLDQPVPLMLRFFEQLKRRQ